MKIIYLAFFAIATNTVFAEDNLNNNNTLDLFYKQLYKKKEDKVEREYLSQNYPNIQNMSKHELLEIVKKELKILENNLSKHNTPSYQEFSENNSDQNEK